MATLPKTYDPRKSKYSSEREKQNQLTKQDRSDAPEYLKDEEKFLQQTSKSYELQNPAELKAIKEEALAKVKPAKKTTASHTQVAKLEHQKKLETFDRFNEDFVQTYKLDKWIKTMPEKEKKEQLQTPLQDFVSLQTIGQFDTTERLSKRLARMGVCSRRQAENLIAQRMVKVDGKLAESNVPVSNDNLIQVGAKTGMYTPIKQNTRIWLYNKPQNFVTTHYDPQGRPTVFDHLKEIGLDIPHVISVGRLDFLSEGLLIVTNDGELAQALEMPHYTVERSYRVRVFGRTFDEKKLQQLRDGVVMNNRQYGPYHVEIENRQNTNTWLHMKLYEGKNNEIRRVMRKFSLRVNRLQRTRYGPYTLGPVPEPGMFKEVPIVPQIKHIMMQYYRDRARRASAMIEDVQNEQRVGDVNKAFKQNLALERNTDQKLIETANSSGDERDDEYSRWKF